MVGPQTCFRPFTAGVTAVLSIPLPFLVGIVFALALYHSLKGVDVPGSRRYFIAFVVLYAAQGLVVGLHFGYGITALAPVQPVTASVMPPLAFLAFQSLSGGGRSAPWRHLAAPLCVGASVLFVPILVDPLLLVIFLFYGVALWRLIRSEGSDLMVEASLQRMRPALRAARMTAALMLFFAVSDAALSVYTTFNGRDDIPLVLTAINIVVLVVTGIYYFAPEAAESPLPNGKAPEANPQDERLVQRATEALDRDGLYRDENLSLAKLARKAGVPARDLSVAINRATGLNISQFVNRRRIAEACLLLRETRRPATVIMFDVGFSTKSNFNREFRRITGMSPRQWRSGSKSIADPGNIGLDVPVAKKQLGAVKP